MPVNFSTANEILLLPAALELTSKTDITTAYLSALFQSIDCWGMARDSTDYMKIDLRATGNIGGVDHAQSKLGIGDGTNYWYIEAPHGELTSSWQAFTFNLDGFTNSGTLNVRAIKKIFWIEIDNTSPYSPPKLYLRNPKIYITATAVQWTNGVDDACNYTLNGCRRHNNTARFGAFPGIPLQRIFNAR
jgi:hypothetical protein